MDITVTTLGIEVLLLLFAIAITAGLMDTLAGGGGLITLPALMLAGVPPLQALGTNKLQGSLGTGTATYLLLKRSRIKWRYIRGCFCYALAGSALGSIVVQFIDQTQLSWLIPSVLIFIAIYFFVYNPETKPKRGAKLGSKRYALAVVMPIGFYDGMFGPGTGSFFSLAAIIARRSKLIFATATAKPLNFATNIASLGVFACYGNVLWHAGLAMMLGQIIGAWLGTHLLYKINPKHLRVLIIFVSLAMLVRYLSNH